MSDESVPISPGEADLAYFLLRDVERQMTDWRYRQSHERREAVMGRCLGCEAGDCPDLAIVFTLFVALGHRPESFIVWLSEQRDRSAAWAELIRQVRAAPPVDGDGS